MPGLFFTLFSQVLFLDKEIKDWKPALDVDFLLATGPSEFTSLVKEVRKLALRLHISVHMLQNNYLVRANSCQRLIFKAANESENAP